MNRRGRRPGRDAGPVLLAKENVMRVPRPVLAMLLLPTLAAVAAGAQEPGPQLVLHGEQQTSLGVPVFVPVDLIKNGHDVTAVAFSLAIDLDRLGFDPADDDGDGIPSTSIPSTACRQPRRPRSGKLHRHRIRRTVGRTRLDGPRPGAAPEPWSQRPGVGSAGSEKPRRIPDQSQAVRV